MGLFGHKRHTPEPLTAPDQVTMRTAYPDDAAALARLAALDCRLVPAGDLLVAEVDGELWAAVSVSSHSAIADPFRPSAGIVNLLRVRAAQLDAGARSLGRESSRPRRLAPRRQPAG